jgi:hypothetical protein
MAGVGAHVRLMPKMCIACLAGLLALACEERGADEERPAAPPPAAESPGEPEPAHGGGPVGVEVDVPPATRGQERMHDRYDRVEGVRDALVAGELAEARRLARGLDRSVDAADLPPAAAELKDAVPTRARALLRARTLPAGARAFASVMEACGRCHRAADAQWAFDDPPLPEGDELEEHMARHAWAVARMWEGLLLGSADRFDEGARRFAEAPLTGEEPLEDEHPPGLSAIAVRLHRRARSAERARDLPARAAIYGDILAGCADCHTRIRELDRHEGGRAPD